MGLTRRAFLKNGASALLGFAALPRFLVRAAVAASPAGHKVLIVLFQRGAADGLSMVAPFADPAYARLRPLLALPTPGSRAGAALDLDGFFGLHPRLAPLHPLFKAGSLAVLHAAGSPDASRSHFDAQDFMETGTPGVKSTRDGWLNRCLQEKRGERSALRAVAVSRGSPRILQGPAPALAIADLGSFMSGVGVPEEFEPLYAQTTDTALGGPTRSLFEAVRMLRTVRPARRGPENGAEYPNGELGKSLLHLAQLIKADVGLELAFLERDGWDTHAEQAFPLAALLTELGEALAAFHRDLGERMADVVLVTMTEFGRAARENSGQGTDHGHGSCMLALGGPVAGGKVHGRWPGLGDGALYEGRDLAATTDFRAALGELLARHLGVRDLGKVFPGFAAAPGAFPGLLRA